MQREMNEGDDRNRIRGFAYIVQREREEVFNVIDDATSSQFQKCELERK